MTSQPAVAVALCVALAGCGQEMERDGRADTIPIHFLTNAPRPTDDQLDAVAAILGLELVVTAERYGAVTLVYYDYAETGFGIDHGGDTEKFCTSIVWAGASPTLIAHELGHANGLQHRDDPENLMHELARGAELTDEQIDVMRHSAWWRFENC